jgi:hypothetical protein
MFLEISNSEMNDKVLLGNVYKPPKHNNNNDNITAFIQDIKPLLYDLCQSYPQSIIAGDFNINLLEINARPAFSDFFDLMSEVSLYPQISLPTRIGKTSCTLIDNIFCSLGCNVDGVDSGIIVSELSDHFPCFVSVRVNKKPTTTPRKYVKIQVNTPQAINNFISDLENSNIYNHLNHGLLSDPNQNYDKLHNKIAFLKEKHFPCKTVKFNKHKHKINDWISNGIIKSIKRRDSMYLELKKLNINSSEYAYKKHNLATFNVILKKTIRQAKVEYYNRIFSLYKNDVKKTWGIISELLCKSNYKSSTVLKLVKEGKIINDPVAIANEFNSFFVEIGPSLSKNVSSPSDKSYRSFLKRQITSSFHFSSVSPTDCMKLINSLNTKNSSGSDGISVKLFKKIAPILVHSLTLIINQSLFTGIYPEKLKLAKVLPLFKKDDQSSVNNYRPISLLPAFSKLFEKVAHQQLLQYFNDNGLFYSGQYGFRDSHSTELAALETSDRINSILDNGDQAVSIFMDLSKAFDTLDHGILLNKLKHYGIQNNSLKWFSSYLGNRQQYVTVNGHVSSTLPIVTGVPQGSILGPLLFIIYMNDIYLSSNTFNFILYADDTNLLTSLRDLSNDDINSGLKDVSDWLALNKLSLNINKTNYLIFHRPRARNTVLNLQINGINLERVKNFNFLGININEHLSWKHHCDTLANKLSKTIGVLNKLKNTLPFFIMRTLYYSLFQSHLNYGLLVRGFDLHRLSKIQKKIVRIINCSKYNAHTEPLFKQSRILKIEDLIKLNSLKFYHKYIQNKLPSYFVSYQLTAQRYLHNHDTRHGNHIRNNITRTHFAQKCLRNYLPSAINWMTEALHSRIRTHSIQNFSLHVKMFMFDKYSTECVISNCYICNRT